MTKPRLLLVDDVPTNLKVLGDLLADDYEISATTSGRQAIEIVNSDNPPELILLDVVMPDMDGYEVCSILKKDEKSKSIPIIFVTSKDDAEDEYKGLSLGAVDYIIKPFCPAIVLSRVKNHLELVISRKILKAQNIHLEERVTERTKELNHVKDITIHSLAVLAETRDNETGAHIMRTKHYVKLLGQWIFLHKKHPDISRLEDVELMFKSAPLHDIGKVGIPDTILFKPGPLTLKEFDQIKVHPTLGMQSLLKGEQSFGVDLESSFLRYAREIAYTHHEKWDGTGYPQGLKGEKIPLSGRIMALADVYDALISERVYKPAFSTEKTKEIIIDSAGTHFDPLIVEAYLDLEDEFRMVKTLYQDE